MKQAVVLITYLIVGGLVYSTANGQADVRAEEVLLDADYSHKHESLLTCSSFGLDPDEYVLYPNGTAYVEAYNRTYDERHYLLRGEVLTICVPDNLGGGEQDQERSSLASASMEYLTEVGLGVSLVFLLVHLLTFALVPDLRNLPGCNLASLCASLTLAYLFLMASGHEAVSRSPAACVASAVLTQFFFLGSFMWMSVMASGVFRSVLRATVSLRLSGKGFKVRKYALNSLAAWSVPLALAAAGLAADFVEGLVSPDFRPDFAKSCWFQSKQSLLAFFAGPVIAVISLNFLLFGASALCIYCNRMRSSGRAEGSSGLRKSHLMYFRLAVIMGAAWITGALAPLANVLWLWYLFAVLNTLQGFFIFVAFTCCKQVRKYFRSKLGGGWKSSQQTRTPTFQSYCFYASSIEKDLDKVMESKERSGSADTVVIHL